MLKGQKILITGANGGIGSSLAEIMLQNNAKVILLYNKDKIQIEKLLKKFPKSKNKIEFYKINLLDSQKLKQKLSNILKKEKIDSFIHCVTFPLEPQGIMNMTWNDFQKHIDLQTKSFFEIVQILVPSMQKRKHGKIISILSSSVVGKPPNKFSNYTVGKYSLLGMIKSMAIELGEMGITVNGISPSMTDTTLIEKFPSKLKTITASQIPLKRLAKPEDISSAALFFCSKHSDYISGENLLISGGGTMY